ncbi:MAG: hypothetical protein IH620_01435, partial [Ignavibacterium sp.]|nr:hypothetical protein [Ignavibacterium sp.]
MSRWSLTISLFLITLVINAQAPPDVSWSRTFGGSGMDWGYYSVQTNDGGFITLGRKDNGSLNMDAWLIKTNINGDTLWTKTYGADYIDEAYIVKQTSDGGYILAGASTAFGWYGEGWLLKTDINGNVIWSKGFHPNISGQNEWDNFYDVIETSDGGFIALGFGGYQDYYWQAWILKVNSNGNVIWNKSFGDQFIWERLYSFQQTSDGGYIAVGDKHFTYGDTTSHDGWLVKFNSIGDTLWTKHFGAAQVDIFRAIQITSDGNYIIAGEREPYWGAGFKGWMMKVDPDGNAVWNNMYGNGGFMSVQKTANGNYIAAGTKFVSQAALNDAWCVKTDANGNVIYDHTYQISSLDDVVQSIQPTLDGGYILGGRTNSSGSIAQIMLVKLESDESSSLTSFSENFDSVVPPALPDNWSSCIKVLISNNIAEVKTMPHGSTPSQPNSTFIMNGLNGSNGQPDYNAFVALVSPLVQIGPNGGTVSFWATGGNPVKVGLMSDPADTTSFTLIEEIQLNYDFAQYSVSLPPAGNNHIAFVNGNISPVTPIFLDNIAFQLTVPVELVSFTASLDGKNVALVWRTATETNNQGFEIEKKICGNWVQIAFVPGFGTSTEFHTYSFTDTEPNIGKNIYRLRQVDFDGSFVYSNEIEIDANLPVQYSLKQNYPNPFNPNTTIKFQLPKDGMVTLKVYDILGNEVAALVNEEKAAGQY